MKIDATYIRCAPPAHAPPPLALRLACALPGPVLTGGGQPAREHGEQAGGGDQAVRRQGACPSPLSSPRPPRACSGQRPGGAGHGESERQGGGAVRVELGCAGAVLRAGG
eukprot:3266198-Rhodomonas_salina.1